MCITMTEIISINHNNSKLIHFNICPCLIITMQPGRATGLGDRSQSAWDLSDQKNRELQICPHIGSQIASSVSSLKIYSLNSSLMSIISDRLSISTRTIPELPDVSSLRLSAESLASVDAEANYYTRRGTERAAAL